MVSTTERRDAPDDATPNDQRRWSFDLSRDQTWQGRLIFIMLAVLRVLERQSYLLALIAMLVSFF